MANNGATNNGLIPPILPAIRTSYAVIDQNALVIKGPSILDALFVRKMGRRSTPTYITTTKGSITTIWTVSSTGCMVPAAKIRWRSESPSTSWDDSGSGRRITVHRDGMEYPSESYCRRTKSILAKHPASLIVDNRKYVWQSGLGTSAITTPTMSIIDGWRCVCSQEEQPPKYDGDPDPPSGSDRPRQANGLNWVISLLQRPANQPQKKKSIAVRFIPPQPSLVQGEFAIDPSLVDETITFLISGILLVSHKDDWRNSQSALEPREVEATLISDIAGVLPPYSPTDDQSSQRLDGGIHPTVSGSNRWRWSIR
ncbi:hypothetical protein CPB86DRAFT_727961 [Serendipita vermifera]|nr:hypothetical protein CPB86DRAFT_727961 [Serendipita vermifera]